MCTAGIYLTATLPLWVHYGARELRRPCALGIISRAAFWPPRSASKALCHTHRILSPQCCVATFNFPVRSCVVVAEIFAPTAAGIFRFKKKSFIFCSRLEIRVHIAKERASRLLLNSPLAERCFWNVRQPGEHGCRAGCLARIQPALNI